MPTLRRTPARTAALGLVAGGLTLVLAACGSRLDPTEVGAAGGITDAVRGEATAGGVAGGTTGSLGSSTDAGAGTAGAATGSTIGSTGGPTGGTSGDTGTAGGNDGGGAPQTGGENAPDGGTKAGSCDGFENTTGIDDKTITIGNASDISGPVPGIFESSQQAVKAYVAYYNATSSLCDRKLALKTYDSRTDAAADQQAHVDGCENVFAMVGSMSAFDSGGASTTEACGLPDIRSAAVTGDRQGCSTCFGAQSTVAGEMNNAVPDYVLKNFPAAARNAAMLYINAGAAAENGKLQAQAMTERGMTFSYVQPIDVAEFNYAPYVQQLKDKGVRYVQMIGQPPQFVRLADAMKQQGFEPDVFMIDPSAYDPEYVESGGDAAEGTTVFLNFTPFEEAAKNKEMQLYLSWLQQVKPGAEPSFFGVFSWSAARLFVERATALGGKLSRESLVDELRKVDNWTANGMHSAQRPGPKRTGECWRFIQLQGGRWVPLGPTEFRCSGTTTVG